MTRPYHRPSAGCPAVATALALVPALFVAQGEERVDDARPRPASAPVESEEAANSGHVGPRVAPGDSGPARFVPALYAAFDAGRALADAAYADRWYRVPGEEGYDATLDRLADRLRAAGFGGADPRLELRFLETTLDRPAWTPRSASLVLRVEGTAPVVLHAFSRSSDVDRVMLPVGAPSADVEGRPVFELDQVEPGTILVTEARCSRSLCRRAEKRGAVAVLSSALFPFTLDPSGGDRHLDAIRFTKVEEGETLPVLQISPRTHERIRQAAASAPGAWLAVTAQVEEGGTKLRTLIAAVVGRERPDEAIAIASHAQEPGAGDNASGIAGICESACSLAGLLREEALPWPSRTIVFAWGDEFRQSEVWLDQTDRTPIAAISADMLGQSPAATGSRILLERMQDPGALTTLPPDQHTPWGAEPVEEDDLHPNGLALIARSALVDVARHVGGWPTSENPWEGGSDHDVYLKRGVPAVLFWHFTDFTYHTSLDRMEMLDGEELRRSCVAVMATALAVADPRPADLERYLQSNEFEHALRVRTAEAAHEADAVSQWDRWCEGAAAWLREHCR